MWPTIIRKYENFYLKIILILNLTEKLNMDELNIIAEEKGKKTLKKTEKA